MKQEAVQAMDTGASIGRVEGFGDVGQHNPLRWSPGTVGLHARSQRKVVRALTLEYP